MGKPFVGIDFGTTNSAIAVGLDGQPPKLLKFPHPNGGSGETWRTVLYFEQGETSRPEVSAGAMAIHRYLESGGDGRFIQSAKSHLASRLFNKTTIFNRNYALEDLVSMYLSQMRSATEVDLGCRAVVGRPVNYWGATTEEDNNRALERMRSGLAKAGFSEVIFEQEPRAAAAKYGAELQREEIVLIADYGGGTSDFCLLRMGPGSSEILATGGTGVGGDTFDGCIVDKVIAPRLGKGTNYSDIFGGTAEVPRNLYSNLRRWHHLAFLRSKKTMALLRRVADGAEAPECIANFIHVVENDLGLPLHQSIEGTKVNLSTSDIGKLLFEDAPIEIKAAILRLDFNHWIGPDLDKLDDIVGEVLRTGGVATDRVDRVFTTGGSSFVPAVRERLNRQFPDKLRGGEEMTSVATGLAQRARELFDAP